MRFETEKERFSNSVCVYEHENACEHIYIYARLYVSWKKSEQVKERNEEKNMRYRRRSNDVEIYERSHCNRDGEGQKVEETQLNVLKRVRASHPQTPKDIDRKYITKRCDYGKPMRRIF